MTANSNVESSAVAGAAAGTRTVRFEIYRYDPDKDAKPYMQKLEVQLQPTDKMLLDALMRIKSGCRRQPVAFRRSCREGVCGSDAMNINGRNGLACITNLRDLKEPIVLRPLPGLPVIRDLIVDMSQFFKQYHSIKPFLINDTPPPEKERLQSPEEREELNGLYECILCACCSTCCPSFWWNPDKFVGPGRPAAGLPVHRRQPRPGHQRAARQPERPVSPVPLPHDHELRGRLPEGAESHPGDRQDPRHAGPPRGLTVSAVVIGELERRRLRWRARRGLLENDIIVTRYLDRHEAGLTVDDVLALEALLDLPDNELLDLLLARKEPAGALDDNAVRTVLDGLRSV